jgi:hypothetical protein
MGHTFLGAILFEKGVTILKCCIFPSIIYSASFDQVYLKTIKDISSKSIHTLSKALNTIHSTTKKKPIG